MRDWASEGEPTRRLTWLWLALATVAAAVVLIALVTMLASAGRTRDSALRLQERSSNRMILAAKLDAAIARSEAALGRFVISGDPAIGGLYADDWRRGGLLLDQLATTSRDDPRRARELENLQAAWRKRGDELGSAALRTTYRQNNEALALYYRIRTTPALTELNGGLDSVISTESAVLSQRSATVDARISETNRLAALVSVVGVALLGGIGLLGWTVLRGAQQRRQEEARSAELEDAVADRTAELSAANDRLVAEMETRAATEAQLRQAQKMDAVGQLTGGLAHDFNNMLAVVLGGVELAKRRLSDGKGDPQRHLDNAMEGANRAAALTKRLLAFARAEPLLPDATDPDALIEGMSDLIDRTLGDRIAVRLMPRANDWSIFVDRHQLESALLNLAVNARDAMETGGTLSIATARVTLGRGDVDVLDAGDYVRISVSDTGTGIEPAVLDRIFEPFFTTKPADKGTGLGLSQVFGYVSQSGGAVTVDSVVGTGTTVSLYLPRHYGERAAATQNASETDPAAGHSSVELLVVEDDRRVLTATVDALKELGHRPVACLGPDAAPALLDAHPHISLVLSDVLMPGMTGPELVAVLRAKRPELRAIFATGFAGDIASAEAFGGEAVLRKPFTIATLGGAIDRVLAEPVFATLEQRDAA